VAALNQRSPMPTRQPRCAEPHAAHHQPGRKLNGSSAHVTCNVERWKEGQMTLR
jgi:hypothetical protein